MDQESPPVATTVLPVYLTPLNLFLIALAIYVFYLKIRPAKVVFPEAVEPQIFKHYTPQTLAKFNGKDEKKILIGVKGHVYDVTPGAAFYGPSGPYGNFAGRDASRGLSKGSFDEDMITPLDHPIDDLKDLTDEEIKALNDWEDHFANKYALVGKLIEEADQPKEDEKRA
ncbi:Damage response protein 1 [Neolecta irregularis DAH-3]|uniref:Damage response protein 1 n=1 Tax=Neolecta irregularis (strain DAH-3) TaxID=1198029 RepID=A0A1U7LT23_NEOID|nr:Damage response protein 1 [Neolecta irregularis DAH-3]|eukprot:OLL25692.1 Damage response protein 1 [Neolecta irregularis DAH-3]